MGAVWSQTYFVTSDPKLSVFRERDPIDCESETGVVLARHFCGLCTGDLVAVSKNWPNLTREHDQGNIVGIISLLLSV